MTELDQFVLFIDILGSSAICIGVVYFSQIWWTACDHMERGYCWQEALIIAIGDEE